MYAFHEDELEAIECRLERVDARRKGLKAILAVGVGHGRLGAGGAGQFDCGAGEERTGGVRHRTAKRSCSCLSGERGGAADKDREQHAQFCEHAVLHCRVGPGRSLRLR